MTDQQQRNAQRAQLDDAHTALTAAGIPLGPHEAHEGCATQLGHRVRELAVENDRLRAENNRLCNEILQLEYERDTADTYASEMESHRKHAEALADAAERRLATLALAREGGR